MRGNKNLPYNKTTILRKNSLKKGEILVPVDGKVPTERPPVQITIVKYTNCGYWIQDTCIHIYSF